MGNLVCVHCERTAELMRLQAKRIAELEATLLDLHDNPIDLASRQSARIAELEGQIRLNMDYSKQVARLEAELKGLRVDPGDPK